MDKRIKFRCAIYMRDYGINIYSNYPKTFDMLQKGSFIPFIPEYRCVKTKAQSDYSLIYINALTSSAKMSDGNKTLEIRGPLREISEASTIPFRAHFMLEQQLQEYSIFTSQGAGVSKQGKAVLLMGKRGSGKTSISLELCRKYNYSLVGGDLVLTGLRKSKGYLFGGSKVFTLRFTTVKYYNTALQKYFKKKNSDEWTNKVNVYPKDLGISAENEPTKIIKAFYVHLKNNKSAPLYIRRIGGKETHYMGRLYLYEVLSRYIRGVCNPVVLGPQFNIGAYLPSLDSPAYHKNRVRLIDWLIKDLGFYYISGSMEAICGFINKELL